MGAWELLATRTLPETNMETPKKGPIKTTVLLVLLKGDYMGFHVSLGVLGGPPHPVIVGIIRI